MFSHSKIITLNLCFFWNNCQYIASEQEPITFPNLSGVFAVIQAVPAIVVYKSVFIR